MHQKAFAIITKLSTMLLWLLVSGYDSTTDQL